VNKAAQLLDLPSHNRDDKLTVMLRLFRLFIGQSFNELYIFRVMNVYCDFAHF